MPPESAQQLTDVIMLADDPMNETLDPDDWERLRALGHRMVDDMLNHFATLRDRPAWQQMPDSVRAALSGPVPYEGQGEEQAYREFVEQVLPYPTGNIHPRFWGWVQGTGTPFAMLADMLAAGLNPHMAGFNQAPALVEHQVLAWLIDLMGMPGGTTGVLAGGGTMANILGLVVARQAKQLGGQAVGRPVNAGSPIVYCSSETHAWVQKAVRLMGLGDQGLRRIPVDDDYQIRLDELKAAVQADRAAGSRPFCVVGTAATVNTGAIDDLTRLADFCQVEGLWFHIDGAFGALARLSPALKNLVAGLERADSLAFDLHKWGYLPFEVACVLVRDGKAHHDTFALTPSYLARTARGVIAGGLPFADRGLDLTRGFKALKIWMSFKAHGVRRIGRIIEQNVRQAQYLGRSIIQSSDLELLAPVPLNVVCFRYAPPGVPDEMLNRLNEELLIRIQESGLAVPSGTVLKNRFAIRVAITNHRTRRDDLDLLLTGVRQIGQELAASMT